MKFKFFPLALLAATAFAQTNAPVPTDPAIKDLQTRFAAANSQLQLAGEKLHAITEFQQYLAAEKEIQSIQQEAQALQAKTQAAKHKVEPVKPTTPETKK